MKRKLFRPECLTCNIRCSSIFDNLETDDLYDININKEVINAHKGQMIFHEGGQPRGVYVVYSGKAKIHKLGDNDKEQITRLAKPGDLLGYRALISGDNYSASATTIEESVICFIPKTKLFEILKVNLVLTMKLMKLLCDDLATAENRIVNMVQKPVRSRVAEALLILKDTYGTEEDGKTLNVIMTREDTANFVGTSTETVIRILSDFKSQGYITQENKKITCIDIPSLEKESLLNT